MRLSSWQLVDVRRRRSERTELERSQLVRRLAEVAREATSKEVAEEADEERKRADAIVRELEARGIYPRREDRRLGAVLRHPLVVGAALAVLSGAFASLLIPALTRVWQDRPKELALKSALVERISRSATTVIIGSERLSGRRGTASDRLIDRWALESSMIEADLTTYFGDARIVRAWRRYEHAVEAYAHYEPGATEGEAIEETIGVVSAYLRNVRFTDHAIDESLRRDFLTTPSDPRKLDYALAFELPDLLLAGRDEFARLVAETPASGFSHGFWIFK
jgi:hypothetical protein